MCVHLSEITGFTTYWLLEYAEIDLKENILNDLKRYLCFLNAEKCNKSEIVWNVHKFEIQIVIAHFSQSR